MFALVQGLVVALSLFASLITLCNSQATDKGCRFWDFQCASSHCINMRKFCDGHKDCPDGSDEILFNPGDQAMGDTIPCLIEGPNGNHTCVLPGMYTCDSITTCSDGADESNETCGSKNRYVRQCTMQETMCINTKKLRCPECEMFINDENCEGEYCSYTISDIDDHCASTIFRCNSGECLSAEQFCDGTNDCEDGSDELTELSSSNGGILCENKWNSGKRQCVLPERFICDGIDHCKNRADECRDNCQFSFFCDNGNCLNQVYAMDGRDHCGDSSDEINHPRSKISETLVLYFKCDAAANTSLALEKFCDGIKDCPDGADEIYASKDEALNSTVCQNSHVALNLTCVVPEYHRCDKFPLCADKSDEDGCGDKNFLFRCLNNQKVLNLAGPQCNFQGDCEDDSDECPPLSECSTTFTCISDEKCLAFSRFCDGHKSCSDESDEVYEAREPQDVMCKNEYNFFEKRCVLPSLYVCDGLKHCLDRADECTEDCHYSFFCKSGDCLERKMFCDGREDCSDGSDESVNGYGFKCALTRKSEYGPTRRVCSLPQSMLYDAIADCDDKSDLCFIQENKSSCFRCLTSDMYLSSKQVCDGKIDCPDLSDECLCEMSSGIGRISQVCENLCLEQGSCGKCFPRQLSCDNGKTCINTTQVCDGTSDCGDDLDELACTNRFWPERSDQDKDFGCTTHPTKKASKCDGVLECEDFSDECSNVTEDKEQKLSLLDGLNTRGAVDSTPPNAFLCGSLTLEICTRLGRDFMGFYRCPNTQYELITPNRICDGIENCFEQTSSFPSSPFSNLSRKWSNFTVDEMFCNRTRVLCHKSRPADPQLVSIYKQQVCDGDIDCWMEEDEAEEMCGNRSLDRFYCEKRLGEYLDHGVRNIEKDPLFVPISKMFDGRNDCPDGSDECPSTWFDDNPFSSRHRMIKNSFLNGLVWIMSICALLGNATVIWKTSLQLRGGRGGLRLTRMTRTNYILVLNLAFSDFLMGMYLFLLALQNALTSGEYCNVDRKWRSSVACASLGTLAMISIQCSVFILIILTTYRMKSLLQPFGAEGVQASVTIFLVTAAWFVSILLACIPRATSLEDYFTSAVWISPSVDFFVTNTPDKSTLKLMLFRLEGLYNQNPLLGKTDDPTTWQFIREKLNEIYPDFWKKVEIKGYFGFYGSNSVCLPQFFVTTNDPVWAYSTAIMAFDLIAFLYIMIAYIIIYHDAKRVVGCNRKDLENKTLQARITRLVVTDFACWVPISIIAFASLSGVNIPPVAYACAAIVLLPINSALNPIIYSNIITTMFNSGAQSLSKYRRRLAKSRLKPRARTRSSRASVAASMTSNDFLNSPESVPMVGSCTNGAVLRNNGSIATTTTRV